MFTIYIFFFFSSRRRHTRCSRDWSSDVCSSDLKGGPAEDASRGRNKDQSTNRRTLKRAWKGNEPRGGARSRTVSRNPNHAATHTRQEQPSDYGLQRPNRIASKVQGRADPNLEDRKSV